MNLGLLLSALLGFLSTVSVSAYSYGAGGCAGGYAAVGGTHYKGKITTGTLSMGGFRVTLDSKPLSEINPANFTIGQNHYLGLEVTSASYFKGILFRLGSNGKVDTTKALSVTSGDSTLRLAYDTCIPLGAGGVTHTSDDGKTVATSILRLNKAALSLPLDITVVVANDDGVSKFYYSGFVLNAVAGKRTPIKAPVWSPAAQRPISD